MTAFITAKTPWRIGPAACIALFGLSLAGCTGTSEPDPPTRDTSARWDLLSEDDLNSWDDKDSGTTDSGGEKDDSCGPEVVLGQPCEGNWRATVCVDDRGEYWWCEGGVWTTGK